MKTNPLRIAQAARAFVRITVNPSRLNEVFNLSHAVADPSVLQSIADEVRKSPTGAQALAEKPRLKIDLAGLRHLPEGTLGRVFADKMDAMGLDPAALPTLPANDDAEFVRAHLYDTHDLWHAVTGFHTDVAGELGLQAFYAAQTGGRLPIAILSAGLLNALLFTPGERETRLEEISRGFQMGKKAVKLFGVRWDKLWTQPIEDVRRALGISGDDAEAGERLAA
jgi:ubiquinone biosynthesis protein Coq4